MAAGACSKLERLYCPTNTMPPSQPFGSFRALRIAAFISGCLMACVAVAQSLEIIELRYRSAAEVIPILQPLLESGGALTGQDYKLFVRASSANLAQLRKALAAKLDLPLAIRHSYLRSSAM